MKKALTAGAVAFAATAATAVPIQYRFYHQGDVRHDTHLGYIVLDSSIIDTLHDTSRPNLLVDWSKVYEVNLDWSDTLGVKGVWTKADFTGLRLATDRPVDWRLDYALPDGTNAEGDIAGMGWLTTFQFLPAHNQAPFPGPDPLKMQTVSAPWEYQGIVFDIGENMHIHSFYPDRSYVHAVPEPSTYALMALGIAAVGLFARGRTRARAA